jgi:undecaprenyl-diphosphatase
LSRASSSGDIFLDGEFKGAKMTSWESSLDTALFHLINTTGQNFFFDVFMPFMTDFNHFTYVLPLLACWILWKERKAGLVFLVFIVLTLAMTDFLSSLLLKEWVGRIRPCQILPDVRLLTDCNTSYSFPSSHAVNIFAAAYFLSQPFRRLSPVFYGIAAVVGYSRVYIGIHYPLDVMGGAAIGLLLAWPMRRLKDLALRSFHISTAAATKPQLPTEAVKSEE